MTQRLGRVLRNSIKSQSARLYYEAYGLLQWHTNNSSNKNKKNNKYNNKNKCKTCQSHIYSMTELLRDQFLHV